MSGKTLLGIVVALIAALWLYHYAHRHAVSQTQAAISSVAADPASATSSVEQTPTPPAHNGPVVHGLPTSKDAGDLAMEWNIWAVAQRMTLHSDRSTIEGRLPGLHAEREKLAAMPMTDPCAQAAQQAQLASMDADIDYFKAKADSFNAHTFDSQEERDAAVRAHDADEHAGQMAMACTTP